MDTALRDRTISSLYLDDALRRQSGRRKALIATIPEVGAALGGKPPELSDLLKLADDLHAATCIVDDMLDGDELRGGEPTYYRRHGSGTAALAAVKLFARVFGHVVNMGAEALFVDRLYRLIETEEADVGLISRPAALSPLEWYRAKVGRKTSEELLLLADAGLRGTSHAAVESVRRVFDRLGYLLQCTNDRTDIIVRDPFVRLETSGRYVFTYSLPLAACATHISPDVERLVGRQLPRNEASEWFRIIRGEESRTLVDVHITEAYEATSVAIEQSALSELRPLQAIADSAIAGTFW